MDEERSGRRTKSQSTGLNALCPHVNDLTFIPLCDLEQVPQLPYPSQLGHVFVVCMCIGLWGDVTIHIKCCG